MRTIKKMVILLIAILIMIGLVGCGEENIEENKNLNNNNSNTLVENEENNQNEIEEKNNYSNESNSNETNENIISNENSNDNENKDNSNDVLEDVEDGIIAKEGKSLLIQKDGNKVLLLKGTAYEMGYAHGVLLKEDIQILTKRIIEECEKEKSGYLEKILEIQEKYIPKKYLEEMEGLADGSGVPLLDIKLVNIMPELFHCSALIAFGDSTKDGKLYHARVLDYIVDYGLQDYDVVVVSDPDEGNAFINATFAGFIGSVTGMNEKHIGIGEMGGGGEGKYEGIPMAFLVRMVLEETENLEEALGIFENNKRTCEYYYAISDSKEKDGIGIYATDEIIQTLKPGKEHPMLPIAPPKDSLILSAGERYLVLHERVFANYGKLNLHSIIESIRRPLSMKSNLHNAVFVPEDLKMHLAVAKNPEETEEFQACYQTYYEYDLADLLDMIN